MKTILIMRKQSTYLGLLALFILSLGCDKDDHPITENPDPEQPTAVSKYIISANPVASEGVADYLLTAEDLSEGTVTTEGNGVEQDGTYRYYVTHNNKFFSLLYGQGNPGAVTTYQLDSKGELEKISDFQSETVQAFAPVNDDLLLTKISRSDEAPYAYWYRLDTETNQFVDEGQINTKELAGNGELAFFSWITQVEDKVFLPYMSVKACCNDVFGTSHPDSAWIAVYDYPEMKLDKVITDDRTSFIGRYFNSGLTVDEKGDIYAISSGVAMNNGSPSTTKPSAVTRIKKGTTEFDPDYYFDIEAATEGYYITTNTYAGNGQFLVYMQPVAEKGPYATGKSYAILDVYEKTITWVSGLPDAKSIVSNTLRSNYVSDDGRTVYIGITTEAGSFVYSVDVDSATATRGLEVKGGVITAINKLESTE